MYKSFDEAPWASKEGFVNPFYRKPFEFKAAVLEALNLCGFNDINIILKEEEPRQLEVCFKHSLWTACFYLSPPEINEPLLVQSILLSSINDLYRAENQSKPE